MPRVVKLRDEASRVEQTLPSECVALDVPEELPDDVDATVCGTTVAFTTRAGEACEVSMPNRKLRDFRTGEGCLRPTDSVDARGRTLWQRAVILASEHLEGKFDEPRSPTEELATAMAPLRDLPDVKLLAELFGVPPLEDEGSESWSDNGYWRCVAWRYLAIAGLAGERRLVPAIRLLLDRACYGDPGEIMRGLRHDLERIVDPNWTALADICLEAARSPRLGTQMWALEELIVLGDRRAEPLFARALDSGPEPIRRIAEHWYEKMGRPDSPSDGRS